MSRRLLVGGALAALSLAVGLGAGCAAAGDSAEAAPAKPKGPAKAKPLTRFASCPAFLAHVRGRAVHMVNAYGLVGAGPITPTMPPPTPGPVFQRDRARTTPGPATSGPEAAKDYSDTNVQEAGVDEPDLVKTDGRRMFVLAEGKVQALDVSGAAPRRLGSIEIPNLYASGLMLLGDRLVVLGNVDYPYRALPVEPGIGDVARIAPPRPPMSVLAELDVSDPTKLRVLSRMTVDGSIVAARRTGQTIRVVIGSSPVLLPLAAPSGPGVAAERAAARLNRRAVQRSAARDWLPRVTVKTGSKKAVRRIAVSCNHVSRPSQFSGLGMVTVMTVGVSDKLTLLDSDAIMTDADQVYASPKAMYVATPRWYDPSGTGKPPSGTTLIHKLDTSSPTQTTYRASGGVRGYPLNQFSFSEHEDYLRVATTEEPNSWEPPPGVTSESRVTVLAERNGKLVNVGHVGGLGKGERIYAVRFIGTRGYVVTFRQVDPLYTLDLSDPTRPAVRGELKIPGFSSYLHPIADDLLIGIGQAATDEGRTLGTQVSLFNVADPARPVWIAQRSLGVDSSEAESDHHAFLYWPATGLLAVPAQSYDEESFLGAVGVRVTRAGIAPIGRIEHPTDKSEGWYPVRRTVVVGSSLLTISEVGVKASDLNTLAPRAWVPFG